MEIRNLVAITMEICTTFRGETIYPASNSAWRWVWALVSGLKVCTVAWRLVRPTLTVRILGSIVDYPVVGVGGWGPPVWGVCVTLHVEIS